MSLLNAYQVIFLFRGDLMSVWGLTPKGTELCSADGVECSRLKGLKEMVPPGTLEASRQVILSFITREISSNSPDEFILNAVLNPLAAEVKGFSAAISRELGFEVR